MIFTYINKGYIRTVIAVCYKFTVLSWVVSVKCFTQAVFGSVTRSYPANIRAEGYEMLDSEVSTLMTLVLYSVQIRVNMENILSL